MRRITILAVFAGLVMTLLGLSGCAATMHGEARFDAITAAAEAREETKQERWRTLAKAIEGMADKDKQGLLLAVGVMADAMDIFRPYDLAGWDSPAEENITNPTMLTAVGLAGLLKPGAEKTNNNSRTLIKDRALIKDPVVVPAGP